MAGWWLVEVETGLGRSSCGSDEPACSFGVGRGESASGFCVVAEDVRVFGLRWVSAAGGQYMLHGNVDGWESDALRKEVV